MQKRFLDNKIVVAMVYSIINIFCVFVFYPFIPMLLNYPEGTVNTEFQKIIEGMTYNQQFACITVIVFIISLLWFNHELNKLEKLKKKTDEDSLLKLRKSCLNLPYKTYLIQIFAPIIILVPILLLINVDYMTIIRLSITVFSLFSIVSGFSLIFVKFVYTDLLSRTYREHGLYEQDILNKKYGIQKKVLIQLIPMFISGMLLFALVGYSKLVDEKGDGLFNDYQFRLSTLDSEYSNLDELKAGLNKLLNKHINNSYFILSDDEKYTSDGNELNYEFLSYIDFYSKDNGGRVYDYYTSVQAVIREVALNGENITVGIKYDVVSNEILVYYAVSFVLLAIMNLVILIFFGKSIAFDIKTVSNRLNETANTDEIEKITKLPITSDDEIGELEFAFNKILDLEKEQIQQIKQSQDVLMEQERLVTLGQLAGGMAHDINTPLSTIITGNDYFEGGIKKFKESNIYESIKELSKNEQTAKEVNQLIEDIENFERMIGLVRKSINKISTIVNSVRDQIRNFGSERIELFELSKVVEGVELFLSTELKKNNCKIAIEKNEEIYLDGDVGKLEQVVTNIILNAIQAYENKGGLIKINSYKENENAIIEIADDAGGIPTKIAEGLLKQIVSTKGSRGTGFGLYFSNSIIKGVFRGELKFETEEGIGTTFYIVLPIKNKGE